MTTIVKPETAPYLAAFRDRARDAAEPDWLAAKREAALARFAELGFPTRREEAWRFTDLRPLQRQAFPPAAGAGAEEGLSLGLAPAGHRIVLRNGRFAPALCRIGDLPAGVWLASTARTARERPELLRAAFDASDSEGAQPFASLNAALYADGFVLALEDDAALDAPVEIVHIGRAGGHGQYLRNLVALGAGSRAEILERWMGDGVGFANVVTQFALGPGASLRHVKIQDESPDAIHFALHRAALAAKAQFQSFTLTLGARLSRQDTLVTLAGEGAQLILDGAYLLRGDQEATTATFVDHAAPGGTTRELFKGVVEDRAHGVFLGRIAVRPEAQRTDAHQLNRNLLLSRRAAVDTKPELEILADDVKCSHGATVGDLDETALFYLRSRGIPEAEARRILIESFVLEALERIENRQLREHLVQNVQRWLATERK